MKSMKLRKLTFLLFEVNAAIDSGDYNISFDEMGGHTEKGDLIEFLRDDLDMDLSLFETEMVKEINERIMDISNVVDSQRKFGVKNNGLCLAIAYLVELLRGASNSLHRLISWL